MVRSNRRAFPPLKRKRATSSGSENDELEGNTEEADRREDARPDQNYEREHYTFSAENEGSELIRETSGGTALSQLLGKVSDSVLVFVAAACMSRATHADFMRFLSSHNDPDFKRDALEIWKNELTTYNKHYICNSCGTELSQSETCCGPILKYIRAGGSKELTDIVEYFIEDILYIRGLLKAGKEKHHNLNGSYLRKLREVESPGRLELSVIASIDGVSMVGNTKKKLWPITMMLIDLPTAEMQKAPNLVLQGLVEGTVNPSTAFWNAILPYIYTDVEHDVGELEGKEFRFNIVSWTADQPAKRSLFGFKGCNSEGSCFFGMCSGTHHKTMARARNVVRNGQLTDEDAENGAHGFGSVPPKVVSFVYPYDTIVDLLHNGSEGIFPLITSETLSTSDKDPRKSDLFCNESALHEKLCNSVVAPSEFRATDMCSGSQKITTNTHSIADFLQFFRVQFGLAAFVNPTLSPEARLTIVSLMLVVNGMYTNAPKADLFYVHMTAAARWALSHASSRYMTTKAHEFLCHLPFVINQFGNVAPLSTFTYEHFYKYSLKGFNSQMTKGFSESVASRVFLHSSVRREVLKRARKGKTAEVINFLAFTPELREPDPTWRNPIEKLDSNDFLPEISHCRYFASLLLPLGRLESSYKGKNCGRDIFFAENMNGIHACYRFVAACVYGEKVVILAERIRSLGPSEQFSLIREMAEKMDRPGNTYYYNVLGQLKRFAGLIHGKPSGEREIIEIDQMKGVGCYLNDGNAGFYLQINGAFVHH